MQKGQTHSAAAHKSARRAKEKCTCTHSLSLLLFPFPPEVNSRRSDFQLKENNKISKWKSDWGPKPICKRKSLLRIRAKQSQVFQCDSMVLTAAAGISPVAQHT
jgi:hypothetical protein